MKKAIIDTDYKLNSIYSGRLSVNTAYTYLILMGGCYRDEIFEEPFFTGSPGPELTAKMITDSYVTYTTAPFSFGVIKFTAYKVTAVADPLVDATIIAKESSNLVE